MKTAIFIVLAASAVFWAINGDGWQVEKPQAQGNIEHLLGKVDYYPPRAEMQEDHGEAYPVPQHKPSVPVSHKHDASLNIKSLTLAGDPIKLQKAAMEQFCWATKNAAKGCK